MSSLKFTEDGSGQVTNQAIGMYSKDGEYVEFDSPCECVGQVREHNKSFLKDTFERDVLLLLFCNAVA